MSIEMEPGAEASDGMYFVSREPHTAKAPKRKRSVKSFDKARVERKSSLRNISTRLDFAIPPECQNEKLSELTRPHIDSFNWFLSTGLRMGARNIVPLEFKIGRTRIKIGYRDSALKGTCPSGEPKFGDVVVADSKSKCAYPSEARMSCKSYTGTITATISLEVGGRVTTTERKMGEVPIMLKSDACVLSKMTPTDRIKRKEDVEDIGGYFISSGSEKVIRMLIQQRRNFPIALEKSIWKKHPDFTEYGVSMRCVELDGTICTNFLHYTKSQRIICAFIYNKQQFFIPIGLILRSLVSFSDYEVFSRILVNEANSVRSAALRTALETMFVQNQSLKVFKSEDALDMLGNSFKNVLGAPEWHGNEQVGRLLMRKCVAIHLSDNLEKFNFLAMAIRKLMGLVVGECAPESLDTPSNMEVLTSGHLYSLIIKDRLENWLYNFSETCKKLYELKGQKVDIDKLVSEAVSRTGDITSGVANFIATGNIQSKSSLGLMQASGMCVMAEKINFFRFVSHFRAVHRGSYFLTSRVSGVRKLQPESWGFICPVHTPDGAPCGLLNHLPINTKISVDEILDFNWVQKLPKLGAVDVSQAPKWSYFYDILFNGKVVGYCRRRDGYKVANAIRMMKFDSSSGIPQTLEVAFLPFTMAGCQYPGIFVNSHQSRMVRPVLNLEADKVEYIGNLEQVYLDIALEDQPDMEGYSHRELANNNILSFLANLTPFSECNPSPRNIYQCQMAKQTMGFSSYTLDYRSDNKMYILQTPQSPLSRSRVYEEYQADEYPKGTNAIVAVIAYTGYDMEDSMILNKASVERGLMNANIRKTYVFDLIADKHSNDYIFACADDNLIQAGLLDRDGMPPVGRRLKYGEPFYSCLDTRTQQYYVKKVDMTESAQVLSVRAVEHEKSNKWQRACIQLRITRNPIIGDKNASRAGQKGICSRLYAPEDMPFTEGGMVPDIIFNPHGFPSRMTIGMMVELLANKHAAISGTFHECSTFKYSEERPAIEHFGNLLMERGFNFNGLETMYSGVSGEQLEAAIFFGPIHYQRLRHMVSDKIQGRTTGPIDPVTEQPLKGRSRGGGIRVGEMERDGFLSHGAAYVTMDRLLECSDKTYVPVCTVCGRTLGTEFIRMFGDEDLWYLRKWRCRICDATNSTDTAYHHRDNSIAQVAMPAVMKYLISELAACNISVRFNLSSIKVTDNVLR